MTLCPVCQTKTTAFNNAVRMYDCPRCGQFQLTGTAAAVLPEAINSGIHRRALMSHALRRAGPREAIGSHEIESFWKDKRLPAANEQTNQLILWIGDNQLAPDESIRCAAYYLGAWLGAALLKPAEPHQGVQWVVITAEKQGFFDWQMEDNAEASGNFVYLFRLTMKGWERYSELKKKQIDSRTAFMAMKFGDPDLDAVVENYFKPAVLRTGFELRKLTDNQPAGSIDDQIRASILSGRFVIADLTHGNRGAYWEAGFAEGLGLPVIYTCEKSIWEKEQTHFDTNHLLTIIWDRDNLADAGNRLTAAIRATFRAEAKQDG